MPTLEDLRDKLRRGEALSAPPPPVEAEEKRNGPPGKQWGYSVGGADWYLSYRLDVDDLQDYSKAESQCFVPDLKITLHASDGRRIGQHEASAFDDTKLLAKHLDAWDHGSAGSIEVAAQWLLDVVPKRFGHRASLEAMGAFRSILTQVAAQFRQAKIRKTELSGCCEE